MCSSLNPLISKQRRSSLYLQTVDIIGVCKSAGDVATITSQKTGKELRKKDITLVDKSMSEINVTLWGGQAESFDGAGNPGRATESSTFVASEKLPLWGQNATPSCKLLLTTSSDSVSHSRIFEITFYSGPRCLQLTTA